MSVTELAEAVDVGETTILRSCSKIGFKGYQDFKIALAQDTTELNNSNSENSISDKIYDNMIEVLKNSKK